VRSRSSKIGRTTHYGTVGGAPTKEDLQAELNDCFRILFEGFKTFGSHGAKNPGGWLVRKKNAPQKDAPKNKGAMFAKQRPQKKKKERNGMRENQEKEAQEKRGGIVESGRV